MLFRLATTQRAGTRLFWRRRHLFSLTPASKSGDAEPKRFCFREVELRLCLAARASQQTAGARSCGCVQHADNLFNISYPAGPAAGERRTPDSPRTQPPCYKMHAGFCELLLHHARARARLHCASWQHPGPPMASFRLRAPRLRYARPPLIGWLLLHFQARVASERCSGRVSAPLPETTRDCSDQNPQSSPKGLIATFCQRAWQLQCACRQVSSCSAY